MAKEKKYYYGEEIIQVPRFNEEAGFYTTKARSKNMGKIKSKNTKPETTLRKALWKAGIRFRKNVKTLPGIPDIAIKKYNLAIFVDGSFWHGYNWQEKKHQIKTNREFWIPKIERNIQNDYINKQKLEALGFTVMRFWEHEINQNLEPCINQVLFYIDTFKVFSEKKA